MGMSGATAAMASVSTIDQTKAALYGRTYTMMRFSNWISYVFPCGFGLLTSLLHLQKRWIVHLGEVHSAGRYRDARDRAVLTLSGIAEGFDRFFMMPGFQQRTHNGADHSAEKAIRTDIKHESPIA